LNRRYLNHYGMLSNSRIIWEARVKERFYRGLLTFVALVTLIGTGSQAFAQTPDASPEASPGASPQASPVASPMASPVAARQHGIRIEDMDLAVDPGTDFNRFANGGWLDRTKLPADSPSYGTFAELDDLVTSQLNTVIADLPVDPTTDTGKVKTVYTQALDMKARDEQGVAPLQPVLERINAITTIEQGFAYQQAHAVDDGLQGVINVYSGPSFTDATQNVAYLGSPVLSLPSLDYYLTDSPEMKTVRTAWVETTAKLLVEIGYSDTDAQTAAAEVLAFETGMARIFTTPEEYSANPALYSTPKTVAELQKLVPEFDFQGWLTALGLSDVTSMSVDDIKYVTGLSKLLATSKPDAIRNLLAVQLIWGAAPYLTTEIGNIGFSFNGPVLNGVSTRRPADQRALFLVEGLFPDALGKAYVDMAFSPAAKAQIQALVDNVIAAFKQRILDSAWMSDATKKKAVEKLALIAVKVGYPDKWKSYAKVSIGESLYTSIDNVKTYTTKENLAKIGMPVDRNEWGLGTFEVNAYYNPTANEIVFPAAILQAPFFDVEADAASNYGSIGWVIGHEITHGFDQSGSQFDGYGNISPWWTDEDRAAFEALNTKVADQYSKIEVLPGLFVNGPLTVTENVADLGGLQTAYDALLVDLGKDAKQDHPWFLTQQQRFFIAAASTWRDKSTNEYIRSSVAADSHSPASVRSEQPARNMAQFYEAFDIQPGDPMFMPAADRIIVW